MADTALDAIEFLKADHREVEELFAKIEKEDAADDDKETLIEEVCQALTVHAQLEEEIAYPAFREAGVDSDILDEANIEHNSVKELIADIEEKSDELLDARVKVLSEYVKHHVKEEEGEMFPEVEESDADIEDIGRRLTERKREIMADTKEVAAE
jgi:hemerythrin superfamily protein